MEVHRVRRVLLSIVFEMASSVEVLRDVLQAMDERKRRQRSGESTQGKRKRRSVKRR
jgi:hypothetical protein